MCFRKYIISSITGFFCFVALNAYNENVCVDEITYDIQSTQLVTLDDLQAKDFNGLFLTIGIEKDKQDVDGTSWKELFDTFKDLFADLSKELSDATQDEEGINLSLSLEGDLYQKFQDAYSEHTAGNAEMDSESDCCE